jgi:hypothetical protein
MTRQQEGRHWLWCLVLPLLLVALVLPTTSAPAGSDATARVDQVQPAFHDHGRTVRPASDHQGATAWMAAAAPSVSVNAGPDALSPAGSPTAGQSRPGQVQPDTAISTATRAVAASRGRSPPLPTV